MRRALALVWLFLSVSALAGAQAYTTITATNVTVDNGSGTAVNPPSGSQLCFLGVNILGAPITYTPSGGSPVTGTVCGTLNGSGGLTASLQVANPATASPLGLLYTITVVNGLTTYLTIPTVSLTGTVWSFDAYGLPGTGSALGIGKAHIACAAGAQWTSTTLPPGQQNQTCNAQGLWNPYPPALYCPTGTAYLIPQGGGYPFCPAPSYSGNGAPSGLCVNRATYLQLDASSGANLWNCINGSWTQQSGGGSGSVAWGAITGTLSAQTDLQNALNLKAPLASPALTGTPTAPTASPGTNTTQLATTAFVIANAGSGGSPAGTNGNPQINAGGSAFGPELQVFVAQSGDTIASIESRCTSLCVYKLTSSQTITLSSSHVMSSNVVLDMQAGGEWTVNGSSFSLTGIQILQSSSLTQHFAGTAAIGFASTVSKAQVEWFGATAAGAGGSDNTAAFQACVNTGVVQCEGQIGIYRVDGPVNFTASNSGFAGRSYGQPFQGGGTSLVSTSATNTIFNVAGTGTSSRIYWNRFNDFAMYRSVLPSGTAKNFSAVYTQGLNVQRVQSFEGVYNYYFLSPANLIFRDNIGGHGYFVTETSGTIYDAFVDSIAGAAPQSAHFDNFIGSAAAGLTGPTTACFVLNGVQISDLFSDRLQCSSQNYGVEILDANGGGFHASDIHFTGSILDGIRTSAVYAHNLFGTDTASVEFSGGWMNCHNATNCVDVESSGGVAFDAIQMAEPSSNPNSVEMYIHNSSYISVRGMLCLSVSAGSCLVLDTDIESTVTGNIFQGGSGSATAVKLLSTTGTTIQGNAFGGVIGNGINADGNSNHNHYINLNSFGSSVTVPITDSGSDNQITSSGGFTGMTAGQVPIAATATTGTSSKPLAGSGPDITTGPSTSTNTDCAEFTGTLGQIADSGSPCGNFITSLTTTGTSGPASVSAGVLNIPQYSGGGGGGLTFPFTILQEGQQTFAVGTSFTYTFPNALQSSGATAFLLISCEPSMTLPSGWTVDINTTNGTYSGLCLVHIASAGQTSVTFSGSSIIPAVYFWELSGTRSFDQSSTSCSSASDLTTIQPPAITPTSGAAVFEAASFVIGATGVVNPMSEDINPAWHSFAISTYNSSGARQLVGRVYAGTSTGVSTTPPIMSLPWLIAFSGSGTSCASFSIK